ncbi:hypothetical protein JMUB7539_27340 [Staphylococcus aureus]
MSASLVGSEMCIRDSIVLAYGFIPVGMWAVSYTHLTLPTICSV